MQLKYRIELITTETASDGEGKLVEWGRLHLDADHHRHRIAITAPLADVGKFSIGDEVTVTLKKK
jgi:hypothetical protein